ncbi:phosphatase PAP2 family protein, partial [Arcobacter sp.]|uniref:phosphatase PAP2 family protein n=1 Tax=Arcobacter sp. TaxID=1872629 RepID=UPI003C720D8D
ASAGFALMSIFFLFKKRKNQIIALSFALFIAWNMALYKMFIGDHFLSHTLISMLLAWLIILIFAKILQRKEIEKSTQI